MKLLRKWDAEHVSYDEHRVELSQAVLDEARGYGDLVPIEWGLTSFCALSLNRRDAILIGAYAPSSTTRNWPHAGAPSRIS